MAEKKSRVQQVKDNWESVDAYWQAKADAMDELERFMSGDRYQTDQGPFQRDRRLQQVKGQEIQDTIRHIVAKATEKPRSIMPKPVDRDDDVEGAEAIAALVERRLSDPSLGFDSEEEDAITDARSIRLGIVWMEIDADADYLDAITFACENPRNFRWDPCYKSPHHPKCPWLIRQVRVPIKWARKRYKAKWLTPDDETTTNTQKNTDQALLDRSRTEPQAQSDDGKVTIRECWYKTKEGYEAPPIEPLAEGERYMACLDGCGDRSESQDELGFALDEEMPMSCPTCGGDMERVDMPTQAEHEAKTGDGKTLVIIAPYSQNDADKPLYDGKWPVPRARSFPAEFITAYSKPRDPVGPCDVDHMWPQQVAADNLRTIALQRVYEHTDLWVFPADGINAFDGTRYEKRDDQYNLAFRDNSAMGQLNIERHQGTGLDPSFGLVFSVVQQALTQYRGMSDQGPIEERAKAKSGVALQTEDAIGEVPVEHFKRRLARERSKFAGVVADYELAILTEQNVARVNIEGMDLLAQLSGSDFGRYDFSIEDTPDFTGLDKSRAEAFDALFGVVERARALGLPEMPLVEAFAEFNKLPKATVKAWSDALAAPPMMPGMPGQPGMPGEMPPPGMEEVARLAGLGA